VLVTPDNKTSVQLDELNQLISDQSGVKLDNLSVNDGSAKTEEAEETEGPGKWKNSSECFHGLN
jgi:hypothetical protein